MKRLRDALVWVAGGALLLAMVVDTVAMLGRQLNWPLLGTIEIVQVVVLIGGAGALLVAAFEHSHASVHLLLERVPPAWRESLLRLHSVFALLMYCALLIGSAWLALDLWNGHEESELLRIPYRPLRIVVVITLLVLAVHSARRVFFRERS